jgi:hypothetical protein
LITLKVNKQQQDDMMEAIPDIPEELKDTQLWFPETPKRTQSESVQSIDSDWNDLEVTKNIKKLHENLKTRNKKLEDLKILEEKLINLNDEHSIEDKANEAKEKPTIEDDHLCEDCDEEWKMINAKTFRKKIQWKVKQKTEKEKAANMHKRAHKKKDDKPESMAEMEAHAKRATKPRKKNTPRKMKPQNADEIQNYEDYVSPQRYMSQEEEDAEHTIRQQKELIDGIINADPIILTQLQALMSHNK